MTRRPPRSTLIPYTTLCRSNDANKTYGDADPTSLTTGHGTNFLAADAVTASYSRAAGETGTALGYHITATLSPAAVPGYYNRTNGGASMTIDNWDAQWLPDTRTKSYGVGE